jgi:hypothetical protein
VRFKADVGVIEWQGAPLMHPEAAGGCEARERGRVGSTKVVAGQVLGGDEMMRSAQGGRKMLLFSTSSLRLGVWWVIPAGLVREIARPGL